MARAVPRGEGARVRPVGQCRELVRDEIRRALRVTEADDINYRRRYCQRHRSPNKWELEEMPQFFGRRLRRRLRSHGRHKPWFNDLIASRDKVDGCVQLNELVHRWEDR